MRGGNIAAADELSAMGTLTAMGVGTLAAVSSYSHAGARADGDETLMRLLHAGEN